MIDKVVLISGSSTGIGKSLALACLKRGARVFAGLRKPADQSVGVVSAAETLGIPTDKLHFVQLDVTSDSSVHDAIAETTEVSSRFCADAPNGRMDVLINNAGEGLNGSIVTLPVDRCKNHFDLNVWGPFRLVQAAAPLLHSRAITKGSGSGGQVINISSASAFRSLPGFEVYAAGKFALEGLMQGYAGVAAMDKVAVTNVQPGPVNTEFAQRVQQDTSVTPAGAGNGVVAGGKKGATTTLLAQRLAKLAEFNAHRLATFEGALSADDVAAVVTGLIDAHSAGEEVPLSVPVGNAVVEVCCVHVDLLHLFVAARTSAGVFHWPGLCLHASASPRCHLSVFNNRLDREKRAMITTDAFCACVCRSFVRAWCAALGSMRHRDFTIRRDATSSKREQIS